MNVETKKFSRRTVLKLLSAGAALSGFAAVPSFAMAQQTGPSDQTIADIAVMTSDLSTLVTALKAADLVGTLSGPGPFTVFAPTDAAFAKLPSGTLNTLLLPENRQKLIDVLTYHVVPGTVKVAQVIHLSSAKTVEGDSVEIKVVGGKVYVNDAQVIQTDIPASNGVIHVIDTVLLPQAKPSTIVDTATAAGTFKWLTLFAQTAGLVDTLSGPGPFTVFAPTDAAFTKLPSSTLGALLQPENKQMLVDILTYHVVPSAVKAAQVVHLNSAKTVEGQPVSIKVTDGKVYINDAQVVQTDIAASNGVIHVIDTVLLPPARLHDIIDTASAAGNFRWLTLFVQTAGLTDTLRHSNFTLFAPTDTAFTKLPSSTLGALLQPENKQKLIDILTYHVVPGTVDAAQVVNLTSAKTVEGKPVAIKVTDGHVFINDAQVIQTDIAASNGLIHAIDSVLLPPTQ